MSSRTLPPDLHAQHAQLVAQIEEQLHSAALTEAQREQVEAWRGRVESALRRWQAPMRVLVAGQRGVGKSALVSAALGLVTASPRDRVGTSSVLPVGSGATTLGALRVLLEARDDIAVEVTAWPTDELRTELRLLAEDQWDAVYRPVEFQRRGKAGQELKALLGAWLEQSGLEDALGAGLSTWVRAQPIERETFAQQVVERLDWKPRAQDLRRTFVADERGTQALKRLLADLMRGTLDGGPAPRETLLRIPTPPGLGLVDEVIDTQGVPEGAWELLVEGRGDLLTGLEAGDPVVVVGRYEDPPGQIPEALLRRALSARRPLREGSDAGLMLVLIDRREAVEDRSEAAWRRAASQMVQECRERLLQEKVVDRIDEVPVYAVDVRTEAAHMTTLLAGAAAAAWERRTEGLRAAITDAAAALSSLNQVKQQERLQRLDIILAAEWLAGWARDEVDLQQPLALVGARIAQGYSEDVQHHSHLGAAIRRQGRYPGVLDLAELAGRLGSEQSVSQLSAAQQAVFTATLGGVLGRLPTGGWAHVQMRLGGLEASLQSTGSALAASLETAVRQQIGGEFGRSLWQACEARLGGGAGMMRDVGAMLRDHARSAPLPLPVQVPPSPPVAPPRPPLLRLRALRLRGFRCFVDAHIQLGEVTLLVGDNGHGKSAVFDALRLLLAPVVAALGGPPVEEPKPRDLHRASFSDESTPPHGALRLSCEVDLFGRTLRWSVAAQGEGEAFRPQSDLGPMSALAAEWAAALAAAPNRPLPLVVAYGAHRRSDLQGAESEGSPRREARLDGYQGCLNGRAEPEAMVAWFRRRTFAELQRRRPDRALRGVSATVASMVEGMRRLYYDVALEELFAEWEGGKVQPLSTLSSGYQSMLALAADLAFRACALNPQLFEWAPTLAQGVVLIDEVDLHLHPRWQRRVLGSLRRTFPHLQFVCTTHSPQVLAAADPAWIRVLEEGAIRQGVDRSRGLDSNTLLQEVFGVPERPAETLQEIGLAREQIAQGQLPAATRTVDRLERDLGGSAEVIRALRWEILDAQAGED